VRLSDGDLLSNYNLTIMIHKSFAPIFQNATLAKWHVHLKYDKNGDFVQEEEIKYLSSSVSDVDGDAVTIIFKSVPDFVDIK
jgi:hypothetical protein